MIYIIQNIVPILIATVAGLLFGALYDRLLGQTSILPAFGEVARPSRDGGAEILGTIWVFKGSSRSVSPSTASAVPLPEDGEDQAPLHRKRGPPPRSRGGSASFVLTAFFAEAWFAAILAGALILAPAKAGNWTMALGTAVVIWIGFVMPVLVVTLRYRGLPRRVVLLDCGHWLGLMLVQEMVLKLVGLSAPVV